MCHTCHRSLEGREPVKCECGCVYFCTANCKSDGTHQSHVVGACRLLKVASEELREAVLLEIPGRSLGGLAQATHTRVHRKVPDEFLSSLASKDTVLVHFEERFFVGLPEPLARVWVSERSVYGGLVLPNRVTDKKTAQVFECESTDDDALAQFADTLAEKLALDKSPDLMEILFDGAARAISVTRVFKGQDPVQRWVDVFDVGKRTYAIETQITQILHSLDEGEGSNRAFIALNETHDAFLALPDLKHLHEFRGTLLPEQFLNLHRRVRSSVDSSRGFRWMLSEICLFLPHFSPHNIRRISLTWCALQDTDLEELESLLDLTPKVKAVGLQGNSFVGRRDAKTCPVVKFLRACARRNITVDISRCFFATAHRPLRVLDACLLNAHELENIRWLYNEIENDEYFSQHSWSKRTD